MHYLRLTVLALLGAALCTAACTMKRPKDDDSDALKWAAEPIPVATNGSIYHTGREMGLFENPVARRVGDTVTIILNESTSAQKSEVTTTTKNTTATLPGPTLLGKAVTIHGNPILNAGINDSSKFDGEGASSQSNALTGDVTVTVVKVLPNGNLYCTRPEVDRDQSGQGVRAALRGRAHHRHQSGQHHLLLAGGERHDFLRRERRAG